MGFVVNHEYAHFVLGGGRPGCDEVLFRLRFGRRDFGQRDLECGATSRFAVDFDRAFVAADDTEADGEAHARAGLAFRGEERVEQSLFDFRVIPVPVSVMQSTTRSRVSCVETRTSPPEGIASTAL